MGAFAGFIPWIIFWVVAGPASWEYAAGGALLASLILAFPDVEGKSLKTLDLASIFFFGVLTVLGLILDRADLDWLEDYSQAVSSGLLALIVLGTLPFVPFTEQYARDQAPREVWDTPKFKHTNFVISAVWGCAFLGSAILGVIAEEVSSGSEWLNWIIPIALIIGAFRFTNIYVARQRGPGAGDPGAPGPAAAHPR